MFRFKLFYRHEQYTVSVEHIDYIITELLVTDHKDRVVTDRYLVTPARSIASDKLNNLIKPASVFDA